MLRLFRDSMPVDPSGGFPIVDVPLVGVGFGTGRGTIRDARTGSRHTFRLPRLVSVNGVLCVPLPSLTTADGLHNVELPGGLGDCWVQAVDGILRRGGEREVGGDSAA